MNPDALVKINEANNNAKEALEIAHDNEINVTELKVLQQQNQQDIKNLFHEQKNIRLEIDELDTQVTEIKIVDNARKAVFRNWGSILMVVLTLLNIVGIIYDRIVDHALKTVLP